MTELIRPVNYNPGICQKVIKFRDKPHVISLMTIEKVTKQKLILPVIVHSCLRNTPDRRQSNKLLILLTNIHPKSFETEFSIAICRPTGDEWQLETLFLAIFDPHSSIV